MRVGAPGCSRVGGIAAARRAREQARPWRTPAPHPQAAAVALPLAAALAAVLPCFVVYLEVGKALLRQGESAGWAYILDAAEPLESMRALAAAVPPLLLRYRPATQRVCLSTCCAARLPAAPSVSPLQAHRTLSSSGSLTGLVGQSMRS